MRLFKKLLYTTKNLCYTKLMRKFFTKNTLIWALVLSAAVPLWGERTMPLDVFIIVDSSSAMDRGKDEAVVWLCTTVIDGTVTDGDRLTIWTTGAATELLYSGIVSADTKEEAKNLIKQIRFSGSAADYLGALNEAKAKLLASPDKRLCWTLLVSGARPQDPPVREAESAGLLRYSKVVSFSGWKVLTVGLDIGDKVRQSAANYMQGR